MNEYFWMQYPMLALGFVMGIFAGITVMFNVANKVNGKLTFMKYAILAFGFIMGLFAGITIMASVADYAYEDGRTAAILDGMDIVCGPRLEEE